ncbi:hypothetical protein CO172_01430 [Candidatus Uhrbacteria bacterium CG_4_9_14_3_um_filter_36_7]|uniref:Uncharacterized protein n=1 Tax=Candidatus Uhrbacteria bacterium CG_4_9_14_3_um_filter_36_7 TaxID=1975033 RepID=A0A2M7XHT8_9BACT|nr:MAG: hypothetical protein CO172_01430 [Candidatus Uhrbacteria bacterium CG_4_9_14_3_um_filter_36_7]
MTDSRAIQDILEMVSFIKDHAVTHEEFNELKQDLGVLRQDLAKTKHEFKQDLAKTKHEFKQDLAKTKHEIFDHIDDKLADLRGDLVVLTRKEDRKLCSLVEILQNKKIISEAESKTIFAMDPFGQ